MAIVYLSLGSNQGDRENFLRKAIEKLTSTDLTVDQCSSFIETNPVDCPHPQNKYLNCAVKITTTLPPEELLQHTQAIENSLGRTRPFTNAPRTIDIDILLYDDINIQTEQLTIPHPRMHKRAFVMKPLAELNSAFK